MARIVVVDGVDLVSRRCCERGVSVLVVSDRMTSGLASDHRRLRERIAVGEKIRYGDSTISVGIRQRGFWSMQIGEEVDDQ
ncbi:hypothetical protein ACLOJK_009177 [Asimina triloba]